MKDEAKVEFYRSASVYSVMERFEMTEEQKRIIHAAIVTAKRDNPNMRMIERADALLQELNRTQKPKVIPQLSREELVQAAYASKRIDSERKRKHSSETPLFLKPYVIAPILSMLSASILYYHMGSSVRNYNGRYTFDEAKQYCENKNMVLPLWSNDIHSNPYFENSPDGFWAADGKIIYSKTMTFLRMTEKTTPQPGDMYNVVCVSKSDLTGKRVLKHLGE